MANNKKILVLEGGFNEEHHVSINTAKEVKKILKKNKYFYKSLIVNEKTFIKDIKKFKDFVCYNCLHGPFGEDGKIQKILKKNKLKFTHSNIKSSKLCFNKIKSKDILQKFGILTPKYIAIEKQKININVLNFVKKKFNKFVIKPNESGSSFAVKIIKNQREFDELVKNFSIFKKNLKNHKTILFEEFIKGKELTVSTIKFSKEIIPLEVTEIITKNKFFDYQAKYSNGYSKHLLPAKIKKNLYLKCLKLALKAHFYLGCNSVARSDFILNTYNNKIYFLETNTQPGMTQLSLLPEQAKFKNISFEDIVLGILKKIN